MEIFLTNSCIVIGGWANARVLIRRKMGDNVLADREARNVVSEQRPIKFVVEVDQSERFFLDFFFCENIRDDKTCY